MKKIGITAMITATTALFAVLVAVAVPAVARTWSQPVPSLTWSACPEPWLSGLECATLEVPLDHGRPDGTKIALALTRARHTSPEAQYQGVVLLNRGQWPGPFGRDLPTRFATGSNGLPVAVAATYDWIGFDPRGVGESEPGLVCDAPHIYSGPARPSYVPASAADADVWLAWARDYAQGCGDAYGGALEHLSTVDSARDMDLMRRALGAEKINYYGYDYGTYLGSVYASIYPDRVRRMVLDGVVAPSRVWYGAFLDQNVAFEKAAGMFFGWMAEHDAVYHLGTTQEAVEANYYRGLAMVSEAPIDGLIGPAEYTDIFVVDVYRTLAWTYHAQVLADWVLRGDPAGLRANFGGAPGTSANNTYATYSAVQCTDAQWPSNRQRWGQDVQSQYEQGNTFAAWHNAWYNSPCLFWPARADRPQQVGNEGVDVLLIQGEYDAATPVAGAHETHRLFRNSRLVLEKGGIFHGSSLTANLNTCINAHVIDYLRDGTRPGSRSGPDAECAANPLPVPTV